MVFSEIQNNTVIPRKTKASSTLFLFNLLCKCVLVLMQILEQHMILLTNSLHDLEIWYSVRIYSVIVHNYTCFPSFFPLLFC